MTQIFLRAKVTLSMTDCKVSLYFNQFIKPEKIQLVLQIQSYNGNLEGFQERKSSLQLHQIIVFLQK